MFKAGDKVRCLSIPDGLDFTPGKIYEVFGHESNIDYEDYRYISSDDGDHYIVNSLLMRPNFELVTEEKPMTTFKIGDKVRVIPGQESLFGLYGLTPDMTYTVAEIQGDQYVALYEVGSQKPIHAARLERVESTLEELVEKANEGLRIIAELIKREDVEISDILEGRGDWFRPHCSSSIARLTGSPRILRIKPTPAFEPFETSNGWTVRLKGDRLHIGDQIFYADSLHSSLTELSRKGACSVYNRNGRLVATRDGIAYGTRILPWADADRILEALEKAGVK